MKKRCGYVSNSSSSSFVVVPDNITPSDKDYNDIAIVFPFSRDSEWEGFMDGEIKFGWQDREYHDTASKWNWLVLQAFYGGQKYMGIIDEYVASVCPKTSVNWSAVEKADDQIRAYIDHQSVDAEGTFEAVEKIGITEFLLNEKCYIQNGNDNDD